MSQGAAALAEPVIRRPALWQPRQWPIWEVPHHLLFSILIVELTALGLGFLAVAQAAPPAVPDLIAAAALTACGMTATELARQAERMRQRMTLPFHVNLSSVWTFAAALILPLTLALALVVIVMFHLWWRTARPRIPFYRNAFSNTTILLSCYAASAVHSVSVQQLGRPFGIALALLVFTTVNTALIAGAIAMSSPAPTLATTIGTWDDNLIEFATLSLGALVALTMGVSMWMLVFIAPPLVVLHKAVPLRQLQAAADADSKTGLLNAGAWRARAEYQLERDHVAKRGAGLLVVDLDHFKRVNDTYGHLVGDQVLHAVADTLKAEARDSDLVGRFGGEEFVVLLSGLGHSPTSEIEIVAERIRRSVNQLQVTVPTADGPLTVTSLSVSVGGTIAPVSAREPALHDLLQVADGALFAAKRSGRNCVQIENAVDLARSRSGAPLRERD